MPLRGSTAPPCTATYCASAKPIANRTPIELLASTSRAAPSVHHLSSDTNCRKVRIPVPALGHRPLTIGNSTARFPIIQGGMGVAISLSGLASAVANAGGIGVIAAAGIGMNEPDFKSNFLQANKRALRHEIRMARSLSDGVIGLNVMMAHTNHADFFSTGIEEEIDIIFSGAGLPLTLPSYLNGNSRTKLVPIVSSARATQVICKRWLNKYDYLPDAVVVEGPLAGGHLGFSQDQIFDPAFALEKLIPEVLEVVDSFGSRYGKKIPVIAAGGIYTGHDIRTKIALGVDGVQMGTRFVATHECDADLKFKQAYINAQPQDIVIINSPVGMPGRAVRNEYIDDVRSGVKKPFNCPYHCISTCDYASAPYCIAQALMAAQRGRLNSGFAFAGANAYRITEIISVAELFAQLVAEYADVPLETSPALDSACRQTDNPTLSA
ncbi:nitronate monooxygenase [candidate division GN15 bacterium]|uniref:Nitronate monooxygenase n=1 Tax=candidate division GN15 bacterium TaxID=2072418 RepID=A0A855X2D5_9BACT|nr:MAG: nitronate monooxygenase [candidate division GN15 bacterium]